MPKSIPSILPPIADFGRTKLLLVKIHKATIKERGSLYEAARRFWAISAATARANDRPVLAVSLEDYTILEAYDVEEWNVKETRRMKNGRTRDFYEFTGRPADDHSFAGKLVGKRVPAEFVGGQQCVRYVN